ncbi:MAG: class I SAM-dependent methyltransferase [Gemmatimonadota bacterium]
MVRPPWPRLPVGARRHPACPGGPRSGPGSGHRHRPLRRPLGIRFGVDPARAMARRAQERGVSVARAVGERLPFRDGCFDCVLFVLTLCFARRPRPGLRKAGIQSSIVRGPLG